MRMSNRNERVERGLSDERKSAARDEHSSECISRACAELPQRWQRTAHPHLAQGTARRAAERQTQHRLSNASSFGTTANGSARTSVVPAAVGAVATTPRPRRGNSRIAMAATAGSADASSTSAIPEAQSLSSWPRPRAPVSMTMWADAAF